MSSTHLLIILDKHNGDDSPQSYRHCSSFRTTEKKYTNETFKERKFRRVETVTQ